MSDNKKIWEIVKPLFSNNVKIWTNIKSVENNEIIDDRTEIEKLFNEYFVNIVKKFGIFTEEQSVVSTENSLREMEIATKKYRSTDLATLHLTTIVLWMRKQWKRSTI